MSRIRYLLVLGSALSAMLPVVANAGVTWKYLFLQANFSCENGVTTPGYSVYAVGDRPELGNWDPAKAVRLSPSPSSSWFGAIRFSGANPGDLIQWKCIIRNENNPTNVQTWQPGPNNQVTMTFSSSLKSTGTF